MQVALRVAEQIEDRLGAVFGVVVQPHLGGLILRAAGQRQPQRAAVIGRGCAAVSIHIARVIVGDCKVVERFVFLTGLSVGQ